jgi:hypothetical protein
MRYPEHPQDPTLLVTKEWADQVSTMMDVLNTAQTKQQAREALGIKSAALLAANAVAITGGTFNSTPIGMVKPAAAKFTTCIIEGVPDEGTEMVNKDYVDSLVGSGTASISWKFVGVYDPP